MIPAALAPVVGVATPALAAGPGWRGSGLPALDMLGVFVGIPLGLFLVISLLFVLIPTWVSERRQRSELTWTAETRWFEGPSEGEQAVEVAEPSEDGGGASASW